MRAKYCNGKNMFCALRKLCWGSTRCEALDPQIDAAFVTTVFCRWEAFNQFSVVQSRILSAAPLAHLKGVVPAF